MVNASKVAAYLIDQLPDDQMSPETTENREGYLHVHAVKGGVEKTEITFLVRDFDIEGLHEKEKYLDDLCKKAEQHYPKSEVLMEIKESYRNMKLVLEKHPRVVEYAMEAVRRTGLKPIKNLIRGGTDGARLCFMDVPTPNVFTGGHNFHSKKEWISVQNMEKAVETIVHLSQIWAEKSK
jgi:tripeptide aminopeptidase